ncbi:MAG TPA: (2Fe-2S)-binding protein [Terriglobales bacterium]|nr:(2Fe-2S)-binding protein [Terriglobales bacterium]
MTTTFCDKHEISFTVNGEHKTVRAYPMERLLDVLRQELGLTGTKEGCGEGECGACSILLDGALSLSCLIPVAQAQAARVITIEGVAADPRFRALQDSFLELGGAQCGICTPGMVVAAAYLLGKKANPSVDEIREGLSGNLCRCTGYLQIVEAVQAAATGCTPRA